MRLIKFVICFIFILNFNNKADALTGVGPIKFSYDTMNNFFAYLKGDGNPSVDVGKRQGEPLNFAVNPEGTTSYYFYCPLKFGSGACAPAGAKAVSICSKRSKANGGSKCKLFARGYKVVWNGTNIKFSRKFDEQVVRSVFKQNGWYGVSKSTKKENVKFDNLNGYNFCSNYTIKLSSCKTVSFPKFVKDYLTTRNKSEPDPSSLTNQDLFDRELKNLKTAFNIYNLDPNKILEVINKNKKLSNLYKNSSEKITSKTSKTKLSKKNNTGEDTVKKLQDIKKMLDEGLITEAEFKKLKEEILN